MTVVQGKELLAYQTDDTIPQACRTCWVMERYRSVMRDANEGIAIYQGNHFVEVNEAFARMCGRSVAECIDLPILEVVDEPYKAQVRDHAERRLRGDPTVPTSYEYTAVTKSGERRIWRVTASKLNFAQQTVSVIVRDITDERQAQEELIRQERLAGIGLLATGIVHEVGNPLASISSLVQLLQLETDNQLVKERLRMIELHIDRISKIGHQVMDFAKPPDFEWKAASIHTIIEQAITIVRYDRRFKVINLQRDYSDRVPPVWMMPRGLEQVFVNLFMNALDAMEHGGTLTIRTHAWVDRVEIEVIDTGRGMTDEERRRAFEPFFTTKPVGRGTGLGLSVSYSIIQKHGGTIDIDSVRGKGSRFRVRLPMDGKGTSS